MKDKYDAKTIRVLIDRYLSIEWCRDNNVVPVSVHLSKEEEWENLKKDPNINIKPDTLNIAICNYAFLGSIALEIKEKITDLKVEFLELSQQEINNIIDEATNQEVISEDQIRNDQSWQIHLNRLNTFGKSKYQGVMYYMGSKGGIYTLSADGTRNYKY